MELYVHRPRDQRLEEARRDGRIRRPMNPFMLYRCAFSGLIKSLLSRDGRISIPHQDISRVAGSSWQIESPHVKEKYRVLAAKERGNFVDAFPGYKFVRRKCRLLSKSGTEQCEAGPIEDGNDGINKRIIPDAHDNSGNTSTESRYPYHAVQDLSGFSGAPYSDFVLLPHDSAAPIHFTPGYQLDSQPLFQASLPAKPIGTYFESTVYETHDGEAWFGSISRAIDPEWTYCRD